MLSPLQPFSANQPASLSSSWSPSTYHESRQKLSKRCELPNRRPAPTFVSLPEHTRSDPTISTQIHESPPFSELLLSESQSPKSSRPRRPGWLIAYGESLITRWSRMDVADDVLVARLEELRNNSKDFLQPGVDVTEEMEDYEDESSKRIFLEDEDRSFKRARNTLFCCRELIRTELSYLEGLLQLENGETTSEPPKIMMCYLPALIKSSLNLSLNMLNDPTARGVSKAFIEAESQLESAFIPWCGVIGEAFSHVEHPGLSRRPSSFDGHRKLVRSATKAWSAGSNREHHRPLSQAQPHSDSTIFEDQTANDSLADAGSVGGKGHGIKGLFRRLSLRSSSSIKPSSTSEPRPHIHGPSSSAPSQLAEVSHPIQFRNPSRTNSNDDHSHDSPTDLYKHSYTQNVYHDTLYDHRRAFDYHRGPATRIANVQDLVIQPTQRVMRYVLLLRDLLEHTSDSCGARPSVQQALESASRIATKCNRAQGNAKFLKTT